MVAPGEPYISASEIRAAFNIQTAGDGAEIDRAVVAASRAIDELCGRVFWREDTPTVRRFRFWDPDYVETDDFYTLDGLAVTVDRLADGTYGETLAVSGYIADPVTRQTGRPYTGLTLTGRALPRSRRALVAVTAVWGWEDVPAQVIEAAQLIARKLLSRRNSPDAIAQVGSNQGVAAMRVASTDPDAQWLLAPFIREPIGIG